MAVLKVGKLIIYAFGGALAGVGLAYGVFGESIPAYIVLGVAGAIFFPWLVTQTEISN